MLQRDKIWLIFNDYHHFSSPRLISQSTPRPLPRREFSVRDDYNLLLGVNKITIMSWGWVMEEVNEKIITPNDYLGSEYGLSLIHI